MSYELINRIGEKRLKNPKLMENFQRIEVEIENLIKLRREAIKFGDENSSKSIRNAIFTLEREQCNSGLCDCFDCLKKYTRRGYI